jgi:hypothetical protein
MNRKFKHDFTFKIHFIKKFIELKYAYLPKPNYERIIILFIIMCITDDEYTSYVILLYACGARCVTNHNTRRIK